jgi:hypothetical protein
MADSVIIIERTAAFVVYEMGICRHCREEIERWRVLGWLHVDGFFLCTPIRQDEQAPFLVATP